MYVILALLMLSLLIMVHEAGHFFAARACGIEVQEFSIGMGTLLLKHKSKKGTQFSLRLLPIGGYCQFYGEDQDVPDARAFNQQPVWKRAITVASGPLMNFAVAILTIVIYMSAVGLLTTVPRVAQVEPNAAQAGLLPDDVFLTINGQEITDTQMLAQTIAEAENTPVTLGILRGDEEMEVVVSPFYDEELNRYRIGFSFAQERLRLPLMQTIPFSISYNVESIRMVADTLKNLIFKGEGANDVTGPVGTVYVIKDMTQKGGLDVYLEMIALISVNLGVVNLLPIPGLDGSRLLFLLVEAIRKKPIKREVEGAIHMAGYVILMGLMIVLTYKDIMNFFF